MAAALNITVSPGQASEREFELLQILNAALISENKELREQASKANILKIVLGDIAVNVRRCAAFADRAQSTISTNTPSASASVSAPPVEDILPFEKSILRSTSDSSAGELLKFSTWRKGSMQKLLWDNFAENNRTVGSHRGTASAEEASEALDALISCFLTVDQMLQVRFQMKGQAYFEGLEYMLEKSKAGAKTETAVGAESHVEGTETEASVVDECLPRPAIYEVINNYYGRMNILLSDSLTQMLRGYVIAPLTVPVILLLPLYLTARANFAPQEVRLSLCRARLGRQVGRKYHIMDTVCDLKNKRVL